MNQAIIDIEDEDMTNNNPLWAKEFVKFSDVCFMFTLLVASGCQVLFYIKNKRELRMIVTFPNVLFSAKRVLEQFGLGVGNQVQNKFYNELKLHLEKKKKEVYKLSKGVPGSSVVGTLRNEFLVHVFEQDMHKNLGA